MENTDSQTTDTKWSTLYRAGALAPLIALVLYASQFIILIFGYPFPTTIEGWFTLFQRNKLLGLWYLNALDIVSVALLGIMFLALYVALRRVRPSWMLIAIYFALLGVVVFVVPRALTLSMLPLSDLHAAATTEAQRTMYLTAGETLSNVSTATPQTLGFLFMAVAGLIISAVILRSRSFGRVTGYVGIVGFVVALANYINWIVAPSIAALLMPINGLLWLIWWLLVSVGLFKLARYPTSDGGLSKAAGISGSQSACLPVTRSLTPAYASSFVIVLLVAIASVAGLLYGPNLYPTEEMLLLKLPTDLFTLVVGLPMLLGSMWLARRGRLLGLLCWPGVLLYVLYIYVSYAIGVPFNVLFLAYVVLIPLSAYTIIRLVASIDAAAVRQRLAGAVPERVTGGILVGLAILFTLMNLADVVAALTSPMPDYLLQFPVWIADSAVVAPAWLVGGLLLWRRQALGYVAGAGLLLLGSMLFVGVIFALAFPALYTASPVDVTAIVFILAMSLICFVPFALYARGTVKSGHSSSPASSHHVIVDECGKGRE